MRSNGATPTQTLRVTILGSSCSIPRPGRACSSYLIEGAGCAIVADLGSGSLGNLHRYHAAEEIDAVVISHMHADHFLDLIPMRYTLKYGPRSNERRVAVYLPPGGETMLRRLVGSFARESPNDFLDEVFEIRTYDSTEVLRFGAAAVRFSPTTHFIPTFALRCDFDGASVAYSSDTAPDDAVATFGRSADLFLCEATLLAQEVEVGERGHLSAAEAGAMARIGEVGTLVLTHYSAGIDPDALRAEARLAFDGNITVADDHRVLTVGP